MINEEALFTASMLFLVDVTVYVSSVLWFFDVEELAFNRPTYGRTKTDIIIKVFFHIKSLSYIN